MLPVWKLTSADDSDVVGVLGSVGRNGGHGKIPDDDAVAILGDE